MNLQATGWEGSGLKLFGSGFAEVVGFCEHGNEPPDSIKCWKVFEEPLAFQEVLCSMTLCLRRPGGDWGAKTENQKVIVNVYA